MSKVLGFDISSTTVGWCSLFIDESTGDIKFLDAGFLKPIKEGTIVEKIVHTRDRLSEIINKQAPDYIGIEDIIKFMKGKSSADTIVMLTTFNRMTCLLSNDYLHKSPELFNVLTIRHGLKTNKILPKKEDMPELVAKHLGITFPYKYIDRGKSKGKVHVTNYDRADGIAVALYHAFKLTERLKKGKK